MADVVPASCGTDQQKEKHIGASTGEPQPPLVDCFYIHPTSFLASDTEYNAPISDFQANLLTDLGQLTQQASAFNGIARV